jgi:hypothetical protein
MNTERTAQRPITSESQVRQNNAGGHPRLELLAIQNIDR